MTGFCSNHGNFDRQSVQGLANCPGCIQQELEILRSKVRQQRGFIKDMADLVKETYHEGVAEGLRRQSAPQEFWTKWKDSEACEALTQLNFKEE